MLEGKSGSCYVKQFLDSLVASPIECECASHHIDDCLITFNLKINAFELILFQQDYILRFTCLI